MKLSIVSHACLLVEAGADRLVIDPWLVGSCYWRSWWHLPPARADLVDPATISAVYLTHEHPDHLHFPSLRRFDEGVRLLVPRFPVERMARMLRERGYRRVEEVRHGEEVRVGALRLVSYQYGTDDTTVVVTDGTTTILDMNDAKVTGLALRQILRRHPRIDFLLRSHAPAQAYPFCYTADDPRDLALLPLSYYTDSFVAAVRMVRPRFAVPFASNVCHLHPESREQNAHLVAPRDVVAACDGKVAGTDVVPMAPGDSWERATGFTLTAPDAVDDEKAIERLAAAHADTIARARADEDASGAVTFEEFRDYFMPFVRAIPWVLRRAYPAKVAFAAPDGWFVVDLARAMITRCPDAPVDAHSLVWMNPRLLRDAVAKRGVSLTGISKRIRVHLRRGALVRDAAFWGLLTIYELEYLPLTNLAHARALTALARRWRELVGYVPTFLRPARSLESIIEASRLE